MVTRDMDDEITKSLTLGPEALELSNYRWTKEMASGTAEMAKETHPDTWKYVQAGFDLWCRERGNRIRLAVDSVAASVNVHATGGANRIELWSALGSGPGLRLADDKGQNRVAIGVTEHEVIRTGATQTRAASSIVLYDRDGKILWMEP